jgi:hypothetical protein
MGRGNTTAYTFQKFTLPEKEMPFLPLAIIPYTFLGIPSFRMIMYFG